jgi:hemoglobin-like flavoprotein
MALNVPLLRSSLDLVIERQPHGMGAHHLEYGVTDEMYDWVGAALLQTLAEVAGDDWSVELEAEWNAAYGAISGLMKEGARNAMLMAGSPQTSTGTRPTAS